MNKRFTVHINFVNRKQFLEKDRIFGLDFIYNKDFYEKYRGKYGMDDICKYSLATLYAPNESLMEDFKCYVKYSSMRSRYRILYNNLIISESKRSVSYVPFTY